MSRESETLLRVADLLESEGWIQGEFKTNEGRCLFRAIYDVIVTVGYLYNFTEFLRGQLRVSKTLTSWNDHPDMTKEKLVSTLRGIAEDVK